MVELTDTQYQEYLDLVALRKMATEFVDRAQRQLKLMDPDTTDARDRVRAEAYHSIKVGMLEMGLLP